MGQAAREPMRRYGPLLFISCSGKQRNGLLVHRREGRGSHVLYGLVPYCLGFCLYRSFSRPFWRLGPAVSHHTLYPPVPAFLALCGMPLCYAAFLGPEATVPWHNEFYSLILMSVVVFAMVQACAAGLVLGEHPAEPRTSIREPFLWASLLALMVLDALSDLALTRSFLTAVCLTDFSDPLVVTTLSETMHSTTSAPVSLGWSEA